VGGREGQLELGSAVEQPDAADEARLEQGRSMAGGAFRGRAAIEVGRARSRASQLIRSVRLTVPCSRPKGNRRE